LFIYCDGIGSSEGDSFSSPGSSSSSSSSDPNDPDENSFWKKYWKWIVGFVVLIGISSSIVICYYYKYRSGSVVPTTDLGDGLSSAFRIVESNFYYFEWSNNYVPFSNVVASNPGPEQYAIFSTHWAAILRSRVTADQYDMITGLISSVLDRLVLTPEGFEEFAASVGRLDTRIS